MNSINSIQTLGNVNISNSTNVHIGNVTNINGNIQIIADSLSRPRKDARRVSLSDDQEESEEKVRSDVFINSQSKPNLGLLNL